MLYIARNILLFTLIVDHADGSKDTSIWNIYYHLYLDNQSLQLLHDQAQKLRPVSDSIQSWHTSKYGRLLRICDQGTLHQIRRIWNSYMSSDWTGDDRKSYNTRFESGLEKAKDLRARVFGIAPNLTGLRSAAPICLTAMTDLPELFRSFWEHGVTDQDRASLSEPRFPNPMFASSLEDAFTLHYATDPLLGFHLATAYAPLSSGSPLKQSGNPRLHKVVATARLQFREWSISFRKLAQKNLTIRFFAGDALAFCHTLQHMHTTDGKSQAIGIVASIT
jgi:hypothetical protein